MNEALAHSALAEAGRLLRGGTAAGELLSDATAVLKGLQLTDAQIDGRRVTFATNMQRDPIQRRHRRGKFFEPEELSMMNRYLPKGGTFIDIGANVGNHSVYAGLFCGAERIIPFEPNPLAYRLFMLNVVLNGLSDKVVVDYIGVGASDIPRASFAMTDRRKNLGAARMVAGEGDIQTVRPDDVLRDETPDFIKIDVEGMEMEVLRGLQKTIRRCRPILLVECDRVNIHEFADWRLANGFGIPATFKHYAENRNFFLLPEERTEEFA